LPEAIAFLKRRSLAKSAVPAEMCLPRSSKIRMAISADAARSVTVRAWAQRSVRTDAAMTIRVATKTKIERNRARTWIWMDRIIDLRPRPRAIEPRRQHGDAGAEPDRDGA